VETNVHDEPEVASAASAVGMGLWILANSRQAQRFKREAFALLKSKDLDNLVSDCRRLSDSLVRFVIRSEQRTHNGCDNLNKPLMIMP